MPGWRSGESLHTTACEDFDPEPPADRLMPGELCCPLNAGRTYAPTLRLFTTGFLREAPDEPAAPVAAV